MNDLLKYIYFDEKQKSHIKYRKLQASILDRLDKNNYALIFDEPGTGKTIQSLYAIWDIMVKKHEEKSLVNILILAPNKQLASKWKKEIKEFLSIDFSIVGNSKYNHSGNRYKEDTHNLYITYNGSNYENLGIGRLTNFSHKETEKGVVGLIHKSSWDLIIIDEVHDYFSNYMNALFSERVTLADGSYYKDRKAWFGANKLILLSATPCKAYTQTIDTNTNYYSYLERVIKSLIDEDVRLDLSCDNFLEFDTQVPYQRYFKEYLLDPNEVNKRKIEILDYEINEDQIRNWRDNKIERSIYYGNVVGMQKKIKSEDALIQHYDKAQYTFEDVSIFKTYDHKMQVLLDYIGINSFKGIVFFKFLETKEYIKKVLLSLNNIKVFTLDSNANVEKRNEVIDLFNDLKSERKVLLLTWQIGNYGLNMHGGDTVICYESSLMINQVEQGFGRVDRINSSFGKDIKLVLFKSNVDGFYDSYRLDRLYHRLFEGVLPNLPTKNLLFNSDYLSDYINKYDYFLTLFDRVKNCFNDNAELTLAELFESTEVHEKYRKEIFCDLNVFRADQLVSDHLFNSKYNEYKRINENINNVLDSACYGIHETDIDLEHKVNLLEDSIFVSRDNKLEVVSIHDLKKRVNKLQPRFNDTFMNNINALSNETIEYHAENYKKLQISNEKTLTLLERSLVKKLGLYPIKEEEITLVKEVMDKVEQASKRVKD